MKERPVGNVWVQNFVSMVERGNLELAKEMKKLYLLKEQELKQRPDADLLWSMVNQSTQAKLLGYCIDGEMYDLNHRIYHLKDFRGKYVLIDFWSSGCTPCIMAIPEMEELATAYKDKLNIVSISTDNKNAWEIASEKHRMSWNNWNDLKGQSGIYVQYDQRSIPNYTLVSPEGIVLEQWIGYNKGSLKQKLDEYIKE